MNGPKMRRRTQEHDIRTGNHLLVGIKADERALSRDIDAVGDFLILLEGRQAALQPILEGFAHGDELYALVGFERVAGSPGAAPSAADQAYAKHIAAGGVDRGGKRLARYHGSPDRGNRSFEEITPRCRV